MYYTKPTNEVKRGIAARKRPTLTNFKQELKEYAKGFAIVIFFLSVIFSWQIALAQPVCTHDYKTNITSC